MARGAYDTSAWDDFYEEINRKLSVPALNKFILETAGLINTSIKMRVQRKGIGSYGRMAGYSRMYSQYKGQSGRQVAFRDLTYSGKMFQALTETLIAPMTVKSFFIGAEAKKAEENDARTPFFSHTEAEDKVLNNEVDTYFAFWGK